jgi:hypothetical protein
MGMDCQHDNGLSYSCKVKDITLPSVTPQPIVSPITSIAPLPHKVIYIKFGIVIYLASKQIAGMVELVQNWVCKFTLRLKKRIRKICMFLTCIVV